MKDMRVIAWCMLVAAIIFAALSNRVTNEQFEKPAGSVTLGTSVGATH